MSAPLPFSSLVEFQRERDIGLKISATFDFIRAHFQPLGQCLLYYAVPVPLVGLIAAAIAGRMFFTDSTLPVTAFAASFTPALLLSWPVLMLGHVMLILTVYGYMILRMDTPAEQPIEPPMVGAWIKEHFLDTLGGGIALIFFMVLATLLLVIPAIWLSVPASLYFFVRLRENRTVGDALNRSIALVKNYWWRTLGLLMLMSLIHSILPFIVQIFGTVLSFGLSSTHLLDASFAFYITQALTSLFSLLNYTLVLVAMVFQYFHLVEKKEGRSIYSLLDQLGQPAPTASSSDYRPSVADEEGEY